MLNLWCSGLSKVHGFENFLDHSTKTLQVSIVVFFIIQTCLSITPIGMSQDNILIIAIHFWIINKPMALQGSCFWMNYASHILNFTTSWKKNVSFKNDVHHNIRFDTKKSCVICPSSSVWSFTTFGYVWLTSTMYSMNHIFDRL